MNFSKFPALLAIVFAFIAITGIVSALETSFDSQQDPSLLRSHYKDDPYEVKKLTQRVNHLDSLNFDTYQQRYYIDTTSYVPGGPIFLYIGAEAPLDYYWFSSGVTYRAMANAAHAIKLFVEHRQYGESLLPNDDQSNSFITVEHALDDAIRVVLAVVKDVIPENQPFPKVVAGGGSYAGMLSAYARSRYPHMITAAIASSSPFSMIGQPFKHQVLNFAYFTHVTNDFRLVSDECVKVVRNGFSILDNLFNAGNFTTIKRSLNSCQEINNWDVYEHTIGWLRSAFVDLAQGNNPNDDLKYSYPVSQACEILVANARDPLGALGKVMNYAFQHELASQHPNFWNKHSERIRDFLIDYKLQNKGQFVSKIDFASLLPPHFATNKSGLDRLGGLYQNNNDSQCHDIYEEYIECSDLTGCGGDKVWDYQVCAQLQIFQSCDCTCMLPGFVHIPEEHAKYCKEHFGTDVYQDLDRLYIAFPADDWSSTSNIIFSQGIYDPWCDGGILKSQSPTLISLTARNGSHHYDLNRPTKHDSKDIAGFRDLEFQMVMEMIKPGGADVAKMKVFQATIDQKYTGGCYEKK